MDFFEAPLNDDTSFQQGQFLLAEPFLDDPNFDRTVILLCQHSAQGSFGLILNRPTDILVNEATDLYGIENRLFVGGPVEQNTMHFLHQIAELENALPIAENVFWGGNIEHLRQLAAQGKVTEKNCRFFVGYSGWAEGQLESEVEQSTWIISSVAPQLLFQTDANDLWTNILQQMGGRYKIYANYPPDPRLN